MKKFVSLMILLMLFNVFIVEAGDVLNLDLSQKSQQLIGLKKGDRAEFYINGERNIIIVDKIKIGSVDLTAFIAQETNGLPYYTTLSKDNTLRLDVERDNIDDLNINWVENDENLEYAYLLLQKIETTEDFERENRGYDKYIIIGFIFIIILLVFLVFKYKKSKNKEE
jgi:hypothetical protein